MVIALLLASALPLGLGAALMAADRLGRPLSHTAAWCIALLTAAASLGAGLAAAMGDAVVDRPWVPQIGLRLHLTIDGISAPLVVLAAAVTLLAVAVSSRQRPKGTPGLFYGSLLVVLGAAVAAFTVRDVIGFFIAFEVALVPMWVLIDRFGDAAPAERRRAGWMFALYTVGGSMLMLAGLLVLVAATGTSDLDHLTTAAHRLPFTTTLIAATLISVGLAVKVPLLGVHAWLPRAHTAAPTAGSMMLAAVLLKLGTYGFVRLVALPMPDAWRRIAPIVAILAVAGIIVGGLVCLVEHDLKRLVAWSSIAHMGFVMLALAAGQVIGFGAALYGNIAHGVISALLFAIVGALKARRGPVDVDAPALGLRDTDPRLGFALVVGVAAAFGLPGLAGFWGEILALFAAWDAPSRPNTLFHVLTALAALGAVLAAVYGARVLRAVWAGDLEDDARRAAVDDARRATANAASDAAAQPGARTTELGAEPAGASSFDATVVADASDGVAAVASPADGAAATQRVTGAEWLALGELTLATIALGLAPSPLMHLMNDELVTLLGGVK